jgi:hypothetical protein
MSELTDRSLRKLSTRRVLRSDERRAVAVKRNVHEFVIDAPAKAFAAAFHAVLTEPDARFGRIEVRRAPDRRGQPFVVGERFHGCFSLAASFPRFAAALAKLGLAGAATRVEDALFSDYSEIATLVETDHAFTASYVYLAGSPIAGESRFTVTPLSPTRCRLDAVFTYQEISVVAVLALHLFAAKLHDDVVRDQVHRAAARAGGTVVGDTTATPVDRSRTSTSPSH